MSPFEQAMSVAVHLPQSERERLAKALGIAIVESGSAPSPSRLLPLASLASRPDPVAWRKAESGHAVLADDGLTDDQIPPGAAAIKGIWEARGAELMPPIAQSNPSANEVGLDRIPRGAPVIVHADVCAALACGGESAASFFQNPPVEIRLATAGYLFLLGTADSAGEQRKLRRFVQPFAVLSLGPMASARSVELMIEHSLATGLSPLDALIAATALAHEIPLLTRDPARFGAIADLAVCRI